MYKKFNVKNSLILASLIQFILEMNAFSCPPNLVRWPEECKIWDKYNTLKQEYKNKGKDIENIKAYKALRLIDCDTLSKNVSKHPEEIFEPSSKTWKLWNRGLNEAEKIAASLHDSIKHTSQGNISIETMEKIHGLMFDEKMTDTKTITSAARIRRPTEDRLGWPISNATEIEEYKKVSPLIKDKFEKPYFEVYQGSFGKNYVQFAPSRYLRSNFQELINEVNTELPKYSQNHSSASLSPLEFIASLQQKYVAIHPFSEGAGRSSRALQDIMTSSLGLPFVPAGLFKEELRTSPEDYRKSTISAANQTLDFLDKCLRQDYSEEASAGALGCLKPSPESCVELKVQDGCPVEIAPPSPTTTSLFGYIKKACTLVAGATYYGLRGIANSALKLTGHKESHKPNDWINGKCHTYDAQLGDYKLSTDSKPCLDSGGYFYTWKKVSDPTCKPNPNSLDKPNPCFLCEGRTNEGPNGIPLDVLSRVPNYFCRRESFVFEETKNELGQTVCTAYARTDRSKDSSDYKKEEYRYQVYPPKLTCKQVDALFRYTDERQFQYPNQKIEGVIGKAKGKLRNDYVWMNLPGSGTVFNRELNQDLEGGLAQLRDYKGLVFRGESVNPNYRDGDTINFQKFTSTSTNVTVATSFCNSVKPSDTFEGCHIYMLNTEKGKRIDELSAFGNEGEILIPRSSKAKYKAARNRIFDRTVHTTLAAELQRNGVNLDKFEGKYEDYEYINHFNTQRLDESEIVQPIIRSFSYNEVLNDEERRKLAEIEKKYFARGNKAYTDVLSNLEVDELKTFEKRMKIADSAKNSKLFSENDLKTFLTSIVGKSPHDAMSDYVKKLKSLLPLAGHEFDRTKLNEILSKTNKKNYNNYIIEVEEEIDSEEQKQKFFKFNKFKKDLDQALDKKKGVDRKKLEIQYKIERNERKKEDLVKELTGYRAKLKAKIESDPEMLQLSQDLKDANKRERELNVAISEAQKKHDKKWFSGVRSSKTLKKLIEEKKALVKEVDDKSFRYLNRYKAFEMGYGLHATEKQMKKAIDDLEKEQKALQDQIK